MNLAKRYHDSAAVLFILTTKQKIVRPIVFIITDKADANKTSSVQVLSVKK